MERPDELILKTIPTPDQIAEGLRRYQKALAGMAGKPLEDLPGLQRWAERWADSMFTYAADPTLPIRREISSLIHRITGREPEALTGITHTLEEVLQMPRQDMIRLRTQLAEIARSLGIRVRAGL